LKESLSFTVTQQLNGIDYTTWIANKVANEKVFKMTVAAVLKGVTTDNIKIVKVSNVVAQSQSKQEVMAASAISLQYRVSISDTSAAGFISGEAAYAELTAMLTAAVTSGSFTAKLQQYASQESGASDLLPVTVDDPPTIGDPNITSDDGSSSSPPLPLPALIGIIVGGVVLLGLIIGLSVYYCRPSQQVKPQ
jgi:hypothetical protein